MAVGEAATAKGLPLVPDSGEEGRVRWGAREINRTRDFVAAVMDLITTGKAGFRTAAGITSSTTVPSNATGNDGDIHFKTL